MHTVSQEWLEYRRAKSANNNMATFAVVKCLSHGTRYANMATTSDEKQYRTTFSACASSWSLIPALVLRARTCTMSYYVPTRRIVFKEKSAAELHQVMECRLGRVEAFPVAGIGLFDSLEDPELANPFLKNSFWRNFLGLKEEKKLLGLGGFTATVCSRVLRSLSASAIRIFILVRSPFNAEKSWCTESQHSSSPTDGMVPFMSVVLKSSLDSGGKRAWRLRGMSLSSNPPVAAVRTCSKKST